MSSPSESSPEQSVTVSSPVAADGTIVDSASSARRMGAPPNVTYETRLSDVRARSASPRLRRTISPVSLSVAQQRARTAEQKASSALSGVEVAVDQTRRAHTAAESAILEARSVRAEVTSKIAEIAERADVGVSSVAENLEGKVREVVAHTEARTAHAVGDLQSKTREFVEGHRRDLEAKMDQDRVEARQAANETKAVVDQLSAQLSQLATQLKEFGPARSSDVATGQTQLSQDFGGRLQVQTQRIDTVTDSVQRIEKDTADNTKLLHDLIVNMENLGDSIKYMKGEMAADWQEETPMETDGDGQYQELQDELLAEVSQSFPHTTAMPSKTIPLSMPVPVQSSMSAPSGPSLPDDATQQEQSRLEALRIPAEGNPEKEEKTEKNTPFEFTPISSPLHYPGLDGHPRRITPIPMSIPGIPFSTEMSPGPGKQAFAATMQSLVNPDMQSAQSDSDQKLTFAEEIQLRKKGDEEALAKLEKEMTNVNIQKSVKSQEKVGITGTSGESQMTSMKTSQSSGVSRPTIGETTVSTGEAAQIQYEVRSQLRKMFPGIAQFQQDSALLNRGPESGQPETAAEDTMSFTRPSRPEAIAGSEVSVASTQPNNGSGENQNSFSRMMSTGAGNTAQTFANVQWRPKEPPCYYGRSTEDVHMWTSLVRHYLSFMGGSDVQQVAYAVTLLRDSAHEWFTAYEKKNRQLPRDWAQLSTALLERFGSNIRSQEAQSQLMAISQGNRPVREYASQFEMLLGRLDSYDEAMLLNQFVWGLQPELARSVSLHYPKSIAQAVSLAETTELAVKASRRPTASGQKSGRAPMNQNRGRGQWRGQGRGGYRGGRGSSSGGRKTGGGGRGYRGGRAGSSYGSVNFDPLACYRCGVRGHLARDCPQTGHAQSQGSSNAGSSRGRFSQSGQKGPQRGRGRGRQVRFGALNVLYDGDGNEYPVDDAGQLYVPLDFGQTVAEEAQVENEQNTKN